jgi:hypothetical protein
MKYTRYLLAIGLLAFAVQANAEGWVQLQIDEIVDKVRSMFTTIAGDVKDTAQDFKRQLTSLQQRGDTIKETVEDGLDLLQHRRTPLLDFVNGGSGRCGQGSPCFAFRADLEDFVLDMADLKDRFPQIEKHGLGDGTLLVNIIDHTPPLVLFGLHEILERVPGWQDIPQNLADLYDEIGDPDAFSSELPGASPAAAASVVRVTVKAGGGQQNFGPLMTKTDTFCSKGKQPGIDPVKLNRLKATFVAIKDALGGLADNMENSITVTVAGTSASVPNTTKRLLTVMAQSIDAVWAAVDAHRANLDVCKKIETDIAQRTPLLEYRTTAGNKKAYWVVKGIIQAQGNFSPAAESLLTEAGNLHRNYMWQAAYNKICDAYAAISPS